MKADLVYWLIDDNPEEADDYKRLLEGAGKRILKIEIEPVRPRLASYAPLLHDKRTGGFIFDQRLNDYQPANYDGLELANYVRGFKPELPLFILTNYSPGLEAAGSSVEQVIPKSEVRNHPATYTARLLRRLGEYDQALSQQQKRLKELVDKKLKRGLNSKEEAELDNIRSEIERPSASIAFAQEKYQQAEVERQQELLTRLEQAMTQVEKASHQKPSSAKQRKQPSKSRKTPSSPKR